MQKQTAAERGTQAFLQGNYPKAIECYNAALEEDNKLFKIWSNLAAAHSEIGEHKEALRAAEQVVTLSPDWPKGYFRKGTALNGLYRYNDSRDAFETGLKLSPEDQPMLAGLEEVSKAISELKLAESELFQKDNPDADALDVLLKWLLDGGSIFPKLYMKWYSADFRGVHALTPVRNGEVIMSIPITHIMTCEDAKKCEMGAKIVRSGYDIQSEDSYLAAYLLQEKHNQNSYWKPYLDCLPKDYANMPIYFGPELLAMLKGSFSLEMRAARIQSLREEYDNICRYVPEFASFTHDEFVWARLVVITRQFGVTVDGVETDGLVPYADMLNHKLPRETEWTYKAQQNSFTITALQALNRGEQIYDSYGRKCNSRFFVNYGFSIDVNPDNEAVIRLELPRVDPSYQLKARLLGGYRFQPKRRCQIPANYAHKKTKDMFSFLRFVHAQGQELANIVALLDQQQDGVKIDALSVRNETLVLQELKMRAETALSKFCSTIAEDEKLKDDHKNYPMYSNIRNCIIMRWGEKKVLQFFVDLADQCLPLLQLSARDATFRQTAARARRSKEGIDVYIAQVVCPLVTAR